MPFIETGSVWPTKADLVRIERYDEGWRLFEGQHMDLKDAERLKKKLQEHQALYPQANAYQLEPEGVVYIILNLPRLIAQKFADLIFHNEPVVRIEEASDEANDEFVDDLTEDVPDLWPRLHYGSQLCRALGDVAFCVKRDEPTVAQVAAGILEGGVDLRVVDPRRWFPVCDPVDPLRYVAHQIAWLETPQGMKDPVLRVQVSELGKWRERAFKIKPRHASDNTNLANRQYDVEEELTVGAGTPWPTLMPDVTDGVPEDDFLIIPMSNGRRSPHELFGRSEFEDSGSLFDNLNWSLSKWSAVNDKISHPPRIVPRQYLQTDDSEAGWARVTPPSQFTEVFEQKSQGGDASEVPKYMVLEGFDHETLLEEWNSTVMAALFRHEMAPALIGWQQGKEKESGEAKGLGMATTEVAAQRDARVMRPTVRRLLTVSGKLRGSLSDEQRVSVAMRVGIPRGMAQERAAVMEEFQMGLLTLEQALTLLHPHETPDQITERAQALQAERDANNPLAAVPA